MDRVLSGEALEFLAEAARRFGPGRLDTLHRRAERHAALAAGAHLGLLPESASIRDAEWTVSAAPADLDDRRVEITGPAEPKMMINALNSGARVFMADLEDALSPTWANVVAGQAAIMDAVRGTLAYDAPDGRAYRLGERVATLVVRPRGWHLLETHVLVDGAPIPASLFDAGLYLFHNAAERVSRGTGPYLYLPKLESHHEARLWNDFFTWAQDRLGVPHGSVRATVLIETISAAFEMDEILYELREHAAGLNAGRWDYLFSVIKTFRGSPDLESPDRSALTMTVPFMRAYTERLVRTCHRRGAHAIGGMAAFIPNRRDPEVTERAMAKVRDDKERESSDGFDGTWVAHPDLVPLATAVFDDVLGSAPNQKARRASEPLGETGPLLDFRVAGAGVTEAGMRANVRVALAYLDAWLRGTGAAAIDDLMEDVATAEIARSQLWLWRDRGILTADRYLRLRDEELDRLGGASSGRLADAVRILDGLVLDPAYAEFLTLRAYALLD